MVDISNILIVRVVDIGNRHDALPGDRMGMK